MRRLGTALSLTVTLFVAAGLAFATLLPLPSAAAAATRAAPASPSVTRSAHIPYLNCPAPSVLLTGSIQRRAFAPLQRVTYKVSIRNLSHTTCGSAAQTTPSNPPIAPADLLGPCSEIHAFVKNSQGNFVYPQEGIACPVILGPSLAAGQTVTVTGTWPAQGAQPGRYRIVIDDRVTLPLDLRGPPFVSPPATLPPRTNPLPTPGTPAQPLPNLPAPTVPSTLPTPTPIVPTPTTPTIPTTPTTPSSPSAQPVTRSAHVAFDGCPARAITLTVTVPAGTPSSAPAGDVFYAVTVHNGGNTACGKTFRNNPPTTRQFRVGVCSAMPVSVSNAFGVDVYPGPQIYMCPMFSGPYIAPHTTVKATGSWAGTEFLRSSGGGAPQSGEAPPGNYSLIVDNAVRVPFTLTVSP